MLFLTPPQRVPPGIPSILWAASEELATFSAPLPMLPIIPLAPPDPGQLPPLTLYFPSCLLSALLFPGRLRPP